MKKTLSVFLTTSLLFGCSVPSSEGELKQSSKTINTCSQYSPNKTYELLVKKMQGCYNPQANSNIPVFVGGTLVNINSSTTIKYKTVKPNKHEISLTTKAGFTTAVGELIEISNGSKNCPTAVKIHYMNRFWKKHTNIVKGILAGNKVDCRYLSL